MKEIPISGGYVALVDEGDYDRITSVGAWMASPRPGHTTYAARSARKDGRWTTVFMHSLITGWRLVDHVNGNGLDNRRSNLRPATPSQNQANRSTRRDSSSGFKGVYWYTDRQLWRARITANRKVRSLGYFRTAEAAARAYDEAALELFGAYARPNFPQERSS